MRLLATLRYATGFLCGATWCAARGAPPTFVEKHGVVSIEAEHYTDNVGSWEEVEGRNATEQLRGLAPDFRLVVKSPDHPLAGGLAGEIALQRATIVPWGMPDETAVIAVVAGHDARKAVVFGYERGAELAGGGQAPARRVITTAPIAGVDAFRRLFSAAVSWAGEGEAVRNTALLLLNEPERANDDQAIEAQLKADGFDVVKRLATEVRPRHAKNRIVVVPGSVRVEKVPRWLREVSSPVVLAHKTDIALELGLTPAPQLVAGAPNAMMIRAGNWTDHLRYAIHFSNPGDYNVSLLGQSGGTAGSDEVKIFFNEPPNPRSERFFEMRFDVQPDWSNRATARRPDNRKTPVPAVLRVARAGWHTLWLVKGSEPEHHTPEPPPEYRYPNWRVDKIVLTRAGGTPPTGDGPPETRNDGSITAPPGWLKHSEFLPAQVWPLRDGFVVFEAEALDHDAHWVEKSEPAGFTGASFLEWQGPSLTRSIEGLFGNDDFRHVRQGAPEWSLIVRVIVADPGIYRLDVRNHHRKKDGDNDAWVSLVGARAVPARPIVRLGDSHRDGTGFSWLDWGIPRLELKRGLNEIRIGGRSVGFGVDRIALYREGDEDAKRRALAGETLTARPGYLLHALREFEVTTPNGEWVPYYEDVRGVDPSRHALAIDAKQHKGKFAAARATFRGVSGTYDLALTALTENDGESTYRLRIGERAVGEAKNPARTDSTATQHTWREVLLQPGDVIQVESNSHSNGRIPEDDGFAWARGRWTTLTIMPTDQL